MVPLKDVRIAVVGLGYVGLPLAVAFAKHFPVTGFDISEEKVRMLKQHTDPSDELSSEILKAAKINYTSDPTALRDCNFIVVAVPTPIDKSKQPDLSPVESATVTVAKNLAKGTTIVYESTVYPGVTEEICVPLLEKHSGLKCGDFKVGYSPERINPGDPEHSLTSVIKIVSGMDKETLEHVAAVYGKIIKPGVYRASSIRVAEAAKVLENTQRDLNIALMNELALICAKLNIPTKEVIDAAATKWNFHKYVPGLVGGHCISIDPHYLLYKAKTVGYNPKVILAGRDVNDFMPKYVAELVVKNLVAARCELKKSTVYVMGLAFKDNITDTRNSKIKHTIRELQEHGIQVSAWDPMLSDEAMKPFKVPIIPFSELKKADCIIYARNHHQFADIALPQLKQKLNSAALLVDLTYRFTVEEAQKRGMVCKQL